MTVRSAGAFRGHDTQLRRRSVARTDDLHAMAIELRVGDRHTGRRHVFACVAHPPSVAG
jgi:hypothetical protein